MLQTWVWLTSHRSHLLQVFGRSEYESEYDGEDCSALSKVSKNWAIGFLTSLHFLGDPHGGGQCTGEPS